METNNIKKFAVLTVIILLVALAGAYKLGYLESLTTPSPTSNTTSATPSPGSGGTFSEQRVATAAGVTTTTVNIQSPPLPVNPTRRGVAMLGPSGLYLYIVDTDGTNVKLIKDGLQTELVQENVVDPVDIKNGLKRYIADMYANGVEANKPGNIQFITASSTAGNPSVAKILAQLKEMGVVITMTTPEQEGRWAFNSAIAPQYRDRSILVDITPSITRITYTVSGTTRTVVAKVGSKNSGDISEIRTIVNQIPAIPRKEYCFIIWAAAKSQLRGDASAYSGIPTYQGSDVSIIRGLSIANAAVEASRAQGVFAWEAGYPMGFLGVK